MRTLKVSFPDIAYFEKTRLQHPDEDMLTIVNGSQAIYVRNPAGISVNDFLVLEAFESEDAEIVQVASVDATQHLVELVNPTYIDHAVGVIAGWYLFSTTYTVLPDYPFTAWTWDYITTLQIGVSMQRYPGLYVSCTQVYAEIDYTFTQVISMVGEI